MRLLNEAISDALTGRSPPVPGKCDTSYSGDHLRYASYPHINLVPLLELCSCLETKICGGPHLPALKKRSLYFP